MGMTIEGEQMANKDYYCIDCKYLGMDYDRDGDEIFHCMHHDSRGTNDEFQTACSEFVMEEDEDG